MKRIKLFILAVALGGFSLTSCEQDKIQDPIAPVVPAKSIKYKSPIEKTGGGEEEDLIIIYGVTENSSSIPIVGAEVILFDAGTSNPLDTSYSDTQGEFQFEEESGVYYFKATASGYIPLTTGNMSFPDSNPTTLVLQQ